MAEPGLMFIVSRVRDPVKTPDALYNRFYNEEHLGDVLKGGDVKVGLRYKNVVADAAIPYIALYPIDNVNTIGSPESLKRIEDTKRSRVLGCDDIFNLIHFELRPYKKTGYFENSHESEGQQQQQHGRTIICVAMEPAEDWNDSNLTRWLYREHLDMMKSDSFRRRTSYERTDGVAPRYLTISEYDCAPEDVPIPIEQSGLRPCISIPPKVFDRNVFKLIQAQGDLSRKL